MTTKDVADVVAFAANSCTVILGVAAIVGLIKHRKKLAAFLTLLAVTLANERIKRIKETLGKLDGLNWADKSSRGEILGLMGELAGMLGGLARHNPEYQAVLSEITNITEGDDVLAEPKKRRITHQVHSLLDEHAFDAAVATLTKQE